MWIATLKRLDDGSDRRREPRLIVRSKIRVSRDADDDWQRAIFRIR